MAHSVLRARLVMSTLCAGLLSGSALFIAACTDAAPIPTAPRTSGLHRMTAAPGADCTGNADADPAQCLQCDEDPASCVAGGGGPAGPSPLSSLQSDWTYLDSYDYVNVQDQGGKCGSLWAFATNSTVGYDGSYAGAGYYQPSSGDLNTQTYPDNHATIAVGQLGNANVRRWTKTLVHEAAHAMWGLRDQQLGQAATPDNPEWWAQVCVP